MLYSSIFSTFTIAAVSSVHASPLNAAPQLPIVDLGYVKQRASAYNQVGKFYNFTNVAFAQPPVGNLRWAAPQPPLPQKGVQDGGTTPKICPQAWPRWLSEAIALTDHVPTKDGENEDCLYLDVFVPKKVFDRRNDPSYSAPVLVEIYGGGFVISSKSDNNAGRLVARGTADPNSDGVIYVAMNYRLGYLGWLGGPAYRADGGTPNLGLLDQKFALEWVRSNIHKFGGDVSRITLMGESGGAASVAYQLSKEFSGNCSKPYIGAIIQSPAASRNDASDDSLDAVYHGWLQTLGVKNLAAARKLSNETIISANNATVYNWAPGTFQLFPSNDGVYIKPGSNGPPRASDFPPELRVITSYNFNEGAILSPGDSFVSNFTALVERDLPNLSPQMMNKVTKTLYPPPGPNTTYTDAKGRAELFLGDELFNCESHDFAQVFRGRGYAYKFSVYSPELHETGYHTQDLHYTFYTGTAPNLAADAMQGWFMDFARYGDPNHSAAPGQALPLYGSSQQRLNVTGTSFGLITDKSLDARCNFWNSQT